MMMRIVIEDDDDDDDDSEYRGNIGWLYIFIAIIGGSSSYHLPIVIPPSEVSGGMQLEVMVSTAIQYRKFQA